VLIAISEGFVDPLMDEVVTDFCAQYPKLHIEMDMLPVDDVVKQVAEGRAHIGLAYNPPPHPRIEYRASSLQPVVLLVRPDHPLALRGGAASIKDLLDYPLALMPASYGIGQAARMLEFVENVEMRAAFTSNSLVALKRAVSSANFMTLIGEFAAYREIAAGELAIVRIDHPLFQGVKARLLVKSDRPLVAAASELLEWILRRMSMFAPNIEPIQYP
jgi:DNA-binding transcriptional LysR family regulator